jgi:ATP/maltotriose-dependent transcriptional regulator MalT/two-component SAPR family response regulator
MIGEVCLVLGSQLPLIRRKDLINDVKTRTNVRVILISAPAGYGKTVLATQLAEAIGGDFVNQRVTVWQRDVSNLHDASIKAFHATCESIHIEPNSYSEDAMAELVGGVGDYDGKIVYLIDDLHHLLDYQKTEHWLQRWLDNLPQNVTLILSGREIPPLSVASYIHRNEIVGFGIEKLVFAPNELQYSMPELSLREAERLVSQFDGWIAGIKLALNISGANSIDHIQDLQPEQLFQELLVSSFNDQPPDFQSFLMLASTLDVISEQLCRDVLGLQNVTHHLNRLHAQQLFVYSGDAGTEFHELFRHFLQEQLRQYDYELFLDCHRRVAEWNHSHDMVRQAILHYVEAEQYQDAAILAKHIAHSFLVEGQKEALLQLNSILDEQSPPEMLLYCGIIHIERRNFELSRQLLNKAQMQFMELSDKAQAMRVSIELASNDYRAGNYAGTLARLKALDITYPDLQARRRRLQGLAYLESGQFELAISHLKLALEDLTKYEADFGRSNVLQDLSEAYLRIGDLPRAGEALLDAVALKRKLGNKDDLALALNNLGHFWYRTASYDDAIATLEEGLDIVSSKAARATSYLYWSLADVYRAIGMYTDAERYYDTARKMAGDETYLYVGIMQSFATMRCMQGYWHDAERILEHIVHHDNSSTQSTMQKLLRSAVQIVLHHTGYEALGSAIDELHDSGAKLKLSDGLGIYLLCGWQSDRVDMMERGIRLLLSLDSVFWSSVASFVVNFPQLKEYLARQNGLSQLQMYFDKLQRDHVANVTTIFQPVKYDLAIYTLGQDHFVLNGHTVTSWTVSFERELFLYLYINGAKTRYSLKEQFWADRDIDQAMASFHTTRNRIRKSLGEHAIIYQDQMYSINPAFDVKLDCLQFRDNVTRAYHLPMNDARSEDLINRAIHLYHGDFLPQLERDWVQYWREYYRGLYVDALVRLAENCEQRADYAGAIRLYEQAIEIEPFTEKLYRHVMSSWARLGRRDMIKVTYEKLHMRLQNGIQMAPSRETQNFYHSLTGGFDA